jgi:hypothetical protein
LLLAERLADISVSGQLAGQWCAALVELAIRDGPGATSDHAEPEETVPGLAPADAWQRMAGLALKHLRL